MQTKRHVRRSLVPSFDKKLRSERQTDLSSVTSDTSGQSDLEWKQIQSKLKASNDLMAIANASLEKGIDILGNDENLPIYGNMQLQVDAKEKECNRVRQIAIEMQERFVWDLSLAIKKNLVQQNKQNKDLEQRISFVDIREIVKDLEENEHSPDEWKEWISNQFPRT